MHAIEVEGLTKTYPGGVAAVKPLHFDVAPGEVFGLLGPNGAGKSTTVGMLTTTIVPGYDSSAQLFYLPALGLTVPAISDGPSTFEVDNARSRQQRSPVVV